MRRRGTITSVLVVVLVLCAGAAVDAGFVGEQHRDEHGPRGVLLIYSVAYADNDLLSQLWMSTVHIIITIMCFHVPVVGSGPQATFYPPP